MNNLKGKELDEFFRQAFSVKEQPFNEDHWFALEKRLKKDKQRRIIGLLVTIGAAAMLILAFSVFLLTSTTPENAVKNNLAKKTDPALQKDQGIKASDPKKEPAVGNNKTDDRLVAESNRKKVTTPDYFTSNQSDSALIVKSAKKNDLYPPESTVMTEMSLAEMTTWNQTSAVPSNPLITFLPQSEPVSSGSAKPEKEDTRPDFKPALGLSVFAGPDINGVNNLKKNDGGISGGIALTYKFLPKLSVSVGAAYAKKLYSTDFANYKPVSNYKFPVNPNLVDADCRVLDIPLNLNYTAWSKKDQAIQLTAGLSSYFMLVEDYHFEYDDPTVKGPRYYEIKNRNKHYLGVLNLGVGYEKSLNKNITVGVQPYFKMPITDIGYGNVKLQSAGITTSLNLKLLSLKPKKK